MLWIYVFFIVGQCSRETYRLAVLYHEKDEHITREISQLAVLDFNSRSADFDLEIIFKVYKSELENILNSVCTVFQRNIVGIIGSGTSTDVKLIAELASLYQIPTITPTATNPYIHTPNTRYLLNMLPSDHDQCKAIFSLLQENDWKEFSILTSSDDYGIIGMLQLQALAIKHEYKIQSNQQFALPESPDSLDLSAEFRVILEDLSRIIVIFCNGHYVPKILAQAYELDMLNKDFVYIVTDSVTTMPTVLNGENGFLPLYLNGLLGTRPSLNIANNRYFSIYNRFSQHYPQLMQRELDYFSLTIYDTVQVFGEGLLVYFSKHQSLDSKSRYCQYNGQQSFANGSSYLEAIKSISIYGLTGFKEFQQNGWPTRVEYDILNLQHGIFIEVGKWRRNPDTIKIFGSPIYFEHSVIKPKSIPETLLGTHFICGIIESEPFVMETKGPCVHHGCYRGYMIDLIETLASHLNFTYEFIHPLDGKWGSFNKTTGSWTGIVSDLIEKRIDVAVVPLSVNSQREKVIDFSFPFMDASNVAVIQADHSTSNDFFFLLPFTKQVWYSIIIMNFIVTFLFFLANRTSPYGMYGKHAHVLMTCPCRDCSSTRDNRFDAPDKDHRCLFRERETKRKRQGTNLYNSAWIVATGLFGKTRGDSPESPSARFIIMSWWFFMMVVLSMYTANLAASLTVNNMDVQIKSVHDLLSQNQISWGTVKATHTETVMEHSIDPFYRDLLKKGVHVDNSTAGIEKVKNENFVFIFETPIIDYAFHSACDIVKIGGEFQSFEYGLGFPKNAPYAKIINSRILHYRETGLLDNFWNRWLNVDQSNTCSVRYKGRRMTMGMDSMAGIFLALTSALIFSILLILSEYVFAAVSDSKEFNETGHQITIVEAFKRRINLCRSSMVSYWPCRKPVLTDSSLLECV